MDAMIILGSLGVEDVYFEKILVNGVWVLGVDVKPSSPIPLASLLYGTSKRITG